MIESIFKAEYQHLFILTQSKPKNHQSIVSDGRDLSHYWLFTNVNLLRRSNLTLLKRLNLLIDLFVTNDCISFSFFTKIWAI